MGLDLEPRPPMDPAKKKMIGAVIAWVVALALLFCAGSRRWMAADGVDAGFGPIGWSCDGCGHELGGDRSNAELIKIIREYRQEAHAMGVPADRIVKDPSDFFPTAGYITAGCCVIAALALALSGFFAVRSGIPLRPIAPTTVALLGLFCALISGMVFVAQNPLRDKGLSPVGVSWAFWLFGAAIVGGIVSAQMLAKFKKLEPGDIYP